VSGEGAARRVEFVQSLERGFAVIRAFEPDRTHMSVTDVAQATGLTRAVARRFLLTLVELGYVRNEGRSFSLRPRILELGYGYLSGLTFPEIARPYMEELSAKVQESVSAAVLDADDIVYVANVVPRRVMTINVPIGGRDPAYCTSLGRVLLAQRSDEEIDAYLESVVLERRTERTVTDPVTMGKILRDVREQGYAFLDQELEDGLGAIAVPVHDAAGAVVAAMNVSAYSLRASPTVFVEEFLPALREVVVQIEEEVRVSVQLKASAG
jgi:IclR family pca regulon transcriptional regulator